MQLWSPSNSAWCRVLRAYRRNWTPYLPKGWPRRNFRRTNSGARTRKPRPCLPSIKPARVREGFVSTSRQRRCGAPIPLLPRHAEGSRSRHPLRDAVRSTVQSLCQHPFAGPRCSSSNPLLQNLRSWQLWDLRLFGFTTFPMKRPPGRSDSTRQSRWLGASSDVSRICDNKAAGTTRTRPFVQT